MRRKRSSWARGLVLGAAAAGWVSAQTAFAGEEISRAETLLFETNHLKEITQPTSLHYEFKKGGSLEPGFEDRVEIDIRAVAPNGTKDVATRYLSGERQRQFPPVANARGNPVLMYFLERDIREMQRLTGGNWRYFQKHIRMAFADKAQIRPVSVVHGNRRLEGQEIRIRPYVDDPQKARYERFAGKYYVFVLCDQIPGGVYQIRAVIPDETRANGGQGAASALVDETLTFAEATR